MEPLSVDVAFKGYNTIKDAKFETLEISLSACLAWKGFWVLTLAFYKAGMMTLLKSQCLEEMEAGDY